MLVFLTNIKKKGGWFSLRLCASTCPRIVCMSSHLCQSKQKKQNTEEAYLWLMKNQRYDKWRISWNRLPFIGSYHMSWQTFTVTVRARKSSKPLAAKEKRRAEESESLWSTLIPALKSSVWRCVTHSGMHFAAWICTIEHVRTLVSMCSFWPLQPLYFMDRKSMAWWMLVLKTPMTRDSIYNKPCTVEWKYSS